MAEAETTKEPSERDELLQLLESKSEMEDFETFRARVKDALGKGVITMDDIRERVGGSKSGFWHGKGAEERSFWYGESEEESKPRSFWYEKEGEEGSESEK